MKIISQMKLKHQQIQIGRTGLNERKKSYCTDSFFSTTFWTYIHIYQKNLIILLIKLQSTDDFIQFLVLSLSHRFFQQQLSVSHNSYLKHIQLHFHAYALKILNKRSIKWRSDDGKCKSSKSKKINLYVKRKAPN